MDLKRVELDGVSSNHEVIKEEEEHFHVLAVDDSLIDRKLLEKLLTLSSYHVTCVESGDKALEYLGLVDKKDKDNSSLSSSSQQEGQGSKVNLIMTDYSMPGMNGYDLLKRVKGSSWKDVPVVVMSSENVPSRINMCLEGGAKEFLLKPVKLSDLRKLQSHLSCEKTENNIFVENENKREDGHNEDNNKDNIANKSKPISPVLTEKRPIIKELNV